MSELIKYKDGSSCLVEAYLYTIDEGVDSDYKGIGIDLGSKAAAMRKARETTASWLVTGITTADVVGVCSEGIARRIWRYGCGQLMEKIDP